MQVTTLIENYVEKSSLVAEHGFSLLIETGTKKILFDTGQTGLFLQNASALDINIKDIDYVVLSHGHYDHTGGLYAFLKLNKKAKIICKRQVFEPKYNAVNEFIGLVGKDEFLNGRIQFIDQVIELQPDVFIMPDIILHHPVDTHFKELKVKTNAGQAEDKMEDELFIAIRHENKISIITACSHRGITNIYKTAIDYFNLPVYSIIGGFHLKNCTRKQYNFIVDFFNKMKPDIIGTCHCTGVEKFSQLQRDLTSPVFYNYVGRRVNLKK
jgi:7,8-dihydropterin-6-yl-methyl-4-(beta-D-ribofuranosyl)aminobenzene 5'-phosphate synthase